MKKYVTILVPTDFSKTSSVAAHYAAQLATLLKARVILLSIIELQRDTNVLSNWQKLETQLSRSARKNIGMLLKEVKAKVNDAAVTADIVVGVPFQDIIEQYATENSVNLIVMGTKGATGLQKIMLGSNTVRVIANSSIPVIAIPSKATFHHPKRIVYATDMKNLLEEVKLLSTIANLFLAEILILHIIPSNAKQQINKKLEPELINLTHYGPIRYHVIRNNNMEEAINSFITDTKADMLAMFTHKPDLYEKILGKSITRKMAFQSRIPLLVFNRTRQ